MMMYLCMSKSLHFSSLLTSPLPHTGYALTYKCSVIRYDITPLLTGFLYSHSTHNEAIFLKLFNEFYVSHRLHSPEVMVFCRR